MTSIWDLANKHLHELGVYEPGKPIEETARELEVEPAAIIKLASNENPLGPSPAAITAMAAALHAAHLYPDGGGFYLRRAIADRLGIEPANVILGNGSNEVIEFVAHAFLNRGDSIVTSEYAFVAYKLIAGLFGAQTIEAPSREFKYDLAAILKAVQSNTRLIVIANPNNPTGTLISQREIDEFMKQVPDHVVTVFDEAYYEFLDQPPVIVEPEDVDQVHDDPGAGRGKRAGRRLGELARERALDPRLARHGVALGHDDAARDRPVVERRANRREVGAEPCVVGFEAVGTVEAEILLVEVGTELGLVFA